MTIREMATNFVDSIKSKFIHKNLTYEERILLAKNRNTSIQQLVELSKDDHWRVRYWVAQHQMTPVDAIFLLSNDIHHRVCWKATERMVELTCSDKIFFMLANSKNPDTRCYVALMPNCPEKVLTELAQDKEWKVRWIVVSNPNCSNETLYLLSKDKNEYIRALAVKRLTFQQAVN